MTCPYCGNKKTYVIGSFFDGECVNRSRQCDECNKRFGTAEHITSTPGRVFPSRAPKAMNRPYNYYTIYDSKTDEVVAYGNARECAKQLGVRDQAVYRYISRHKDTNNGKYVIVKDNYNEVEE